MRTRIQLITLMRVRIQLITLMRIRVLLFKFDADPQRNTGHHISVLQHYSVYFQESKFKNRYEYHQTRSIQPSEDDHSSI
jgi:hypothetical protein